MAAKKHNHCSITDCRTGNFNALALKKTELNPAFALNMCGFKRARGFYSTTDVLLWKQHPVSQQNTCRCLEGLIRVNLN